MKNITALEERGAADRQGAAAHVARDEAVHQGQPSQAARVVLSGRMSGVQRGRGLLARDQERAIRA